MGHQSGHHELSHAAAYPELTQIDTWYAEQFAYLVSALKNIPEGAGSVLDNSVLVWGNELADGAAHSDQPIPFVLAGSAGGYFRTGRYLPRDGVSHTRLLVSMCHAMGVEDQTSYGELDDGSGPLAGLT